MHVATLFTDPIEKHEKGVSPEGGVFEMEVRINKPTFILSGDKKKYIYHELAVHLHQAIQDTGVPREFWSVKFTPEIQSAFNLPETTRMSV